MWRTSSASQGMNSCVEVAFHTAAASTEIGNCVDVGVCGCGDGTVHVRDTKDNGTGPVLTFGLPVWVAFLEWLENNDIDGTEWGMEPQWRKASGCSYAGDCVEVAKMEYDDGRIEYWVRDSKQENGPVLKFTEEEWAAFLTGCGLGEFDFTDELVTQG